MEKVSSDTPQALAVQNAEAPSESVSLRLVVLDDDVALSGAQCFGWAVRDNTPLNDRDYRQQRDPDT
jgi:hypothetical protein